MASNGGSGAALTAAERDRLAALRSAETLADLVELTGADSEREAYLAARREWAALRGRELAASSARSEADTLQDDGSGPQDGATTARDGLPGNCVEVDGREFRVHGITHVDTRAEREFLRERVSRWLDHGAAVYCEQGVRSMYFDDLPDVREMDDLSWAIKRCEELDAAPRIAGSTPTDLAGSAAANLAADVESLSRRFRDAVFSLVAPHADFSREGVAVTFGGLASALLTSHEDAAVGDDFESFVRTRRAASNPEALVDLQRFYEKTFLPQPVEREWVRRHDPELELLTHARNERMAAYAVYHHEGGGAAHLIVGAAHQPGVTYYLERFRDGEASVEGFEFVE